MKFEVFLTTVCMLLFLALCGAVTGISSGNKQIAEIKEQLIKQELANERLTACAQRQITSLIKICEANDIPLAQDIRTSEWCEGPKPLTPAEFEEFRAQWLLRLESGVSMMTGRPISLDDPVNGPTVALIAGLKAGRFLYDRVAPTELQKAQQKIEQLEEKVEASQIAGRELHKLIKALDKFALENPEIADELPKHPFRLAEEVPDT